MTYLERKATGDRFERLVLERLASEGWTATRFGQALLADEARRLLRAVVTPDGGPSLLRWMPDVLALRLEPGGIVRHALIDAKACSGPRYAVEVAALESAEKFAALGVPVFFVFDDWGVLPPVDIRREGFPGPFHGRGSGTPFLLVNREHGWTFEIAFPPRSTVGHATIPYPEAP